MAEYAEKSEKGELTIIIVVLTLALQHDHCHAATVLTQGDAVFSMFTILSCF